MCVIKEWVQTYVNSVGEYSQELYLGLYVHWNGALILLV